MVRAYSVLVLTAALLLAGASTARARGAVHSPTWNRTALAQAQARVRDATDKLLNKTSASRAVLAAAHNRTAHAGRGLRSLPPLAAIRNMTNNLGPHSAALEARLLNSTVPRPSGLGRVNVTGLLERINNVTGHSSAPHNATAHSPAPHNETATNGTKPAGVRPASAGLNGSANAAGLPARVNATGHPAAHNETAHNATKPEGVRPAPAGLNGTAPGAGRPAPANATKPEGVRPASAGLNATKPQGVRPASVNGAGRLAPGGHTRRLLRV
jgi:hypothetical protein